MDVEYEGLLFAGEFLGPVRPCRGPDLGHLGPSEAAIHGYDHGSSLALDVYLVSCPVVNRLHVP